MSPGKIGLLYFRIAIDKACETENVPGTLLGKNILSFEKAKISCAIDQTQRTLIEPAARLPATLSPKIIPQL